MAEAYKYLKAVLSSGTVKYVTDIEGGPGDLTNMEEALKNTGNYRPHPHNVEKAAKKYEKLAAIVNKPIIAENEKGTSREKCILSILKIN